MKDRFGRTIESLRISVTDRCNLACVYCVGATSWNPLPHDRLLSYEEIVDVASAALSIGLTRFRLTGGEPLVRRGVLDLVAMLSNLPGVADLAMTTNGILLARHAADLAARGLKRVNVSLDALDPDRYRAVTGGGDVAEVLRGIQAAREAGLDPIKINCVVKASRDEPDARAVARFGEAHGFEVRFIHRMDPVTGTFTVVEGGTGGDCARCNRLRLSSDGMIRPCLFSDLAFPVREMGARNALLTAIEAKPASGGRTTANWIRVCGG